MPNIKITIAYKGTNYNGWQIQPNKPTIQGTITDALYKITGERVTLFSSGRTDAGTHALGHVANFQLGKQIEEESLLKGINSILPWDIRIRTLKKVGDEFHAQRNAASKIYQYQIYTGKIVSPFLYGYCFHYTFPLDLVKMDSLAHLFIGEHDFLAFTPAGSLKSRISRLVIDSRFQKKGPLLVYRIEANGFLRYMVRNIVGTLVLAGRGLIEVDTIRRMLKSGNRLASMYKVPASGLFLVKVKY